jgi:hypothetical protein
MNVDFKLLATAIRRVHLTSSFVFIYFFSVLPVRSGCTELYMWHTSPRIRDGTWPTPYICCNYS